MASVHEQIVDEIEDVAEKGGALTAALTGDADVFMPHWLVRPHLAQTVLSLRKPRAVMSLLAHEQPLLLDGGPDLTGYAASVRLLAYYSSHQAETAPRGLVISLHGWEGNSHSVYNLVLAAHLNQAGYDVVRLNIRDHGPGIHLDPYALNPGLFMGTLIEEVTTAAQHAATLANDAANGAPVYLVGPSLGGNYVLRMAARQHIQPIPNLRRVIAISPAICPAPTTDRLDSQWHFRRYFRTRFLKSLLAKQHLFPQLYDFAPVVTMTRLRAMNEWLIRHYTHFPNADAYFHAYSVTHTSLAPLATPTTIITAADDPVIDAREIKALQPHPLLEVKIHARGGHVGFVDAWPVVHRLPEMILRELARK